MSPIKRRIVFVSLYELIAILSMTTGFLLFSTQSLGHAGLASVIVSVIAITWNLIYNTMFETWEAWRGKEGRSILRRVAHALGFEGGLIVLTVPFFAWWLSVSLVTAFILNLGVMVFFLVYSFLFTWAFDLIFGLPSSVAPKVKSEDAEEYSGASGAVQG